MRREKGRGGEGAGERGRGTGRGMGGNRERGRRGEWYPGSTVVSVKSTATAPSSSNLHKITLRKMMRERKRERERERRGMRRE